MPCNDRPPTMTSRFNRRQPGAGGIVGIQALARSAPKGAMITQGNVINFSSVEYAQNFFKDELAKYALLVRKAGIEPE
jgi:hypothetical protein